MTQKPRRFRKAQIAGATWPRALQRGAMPPTSPYSAFAADQRRGRSGRRPSIRRGPQGVGLCSLAEDVVPPTPRSGPGLVRPARIEHEEPVSTPDCPRPCGTPLAASAASPAQRPGRPGRAGRACRRCATRRVQPGAGRGRRRQSACRSAAAARWAQQGLGRTGEVSGRRLGEAARRNKAPGAAASPITAGDAKPAAVLVEHPETCAKNWRTADPRRAVLARRALGAATAAQARPAGVPGSEQEEDEALPLAVARWPAARARPRRSAERMATTALHLAASRLGVLRGTTQSCRPAPCGCVAVDPGDHAFSRSAAAGSRLPGVQRRAGQDHIGGLDVRARAPRRGGHRRWRACIVRPSSPCWKRLAQAGASAG